jgi:signal transduction histidine kinase
MTDGTRIAIGRILAAVGIGTAVGGTIWLAVIGRDEVLMGDWVIHNAVVAVGFGLLTLVVIARQPRNGAVWLPAWVAVFTGAYCLVEAVAYQRLAGAGISDLLTHSPSELPVSIAVLVTAGVSLYQPIFLTTSLGLIIFPDGRLPSPRWRPVAWAAIGCLVVSVAGLSWAFRPSGTIPYSVSVDTAGTLRNVNPLVGIAQFGLLGLIPVCLAGLAMRFRRSRGAERQQFRWVVWGAAMMALIIMPVVLYDAAVQSDTARYPLIAAIGILLTSYGVAIARYRLYDVDVVISRTVVFVSLGLFITSVYVAIVVGLGYLLGAHDEPNQVLGIVATVVIAIAFQPLRRRLQRIANRIVYGRRATPYEVLSTFSQRVDAVDPDVLGQIAKALAEGTTASRAAVWLNRGGAMSRIAEWPPDDTSESALETASGPLPEADRSAPVTHDGELLGAVTLGLPAGKPFSPVDARLLEQVAAGLGLALRNLLLTQDLRARVDQLRDSRRRIVAVQDETRRQIERDLHDGAQQRLVALKIKLGLGVTMARRAGLDELGDVLAAIGSETDETIEAVRDFARGIYPPLLEAEGLAAALTAQVRKFDHPVTVQAAGLGRYERNAEATVYFCVIEAVHNAAAHAGASSILVMLDERDGLVAFEVRDDGQGFDPGATPMGTGLVTMTDRLDAMGGRLVVASTPGHGTVIRGELPILAVVAS